VIHEGLFVGGVLHTWIVEILTKHNVHTWKDLARPDPLLPSEQQYKLAATTRQQFMESNTPRRQQVSRKSIAANRDAAAGSFPISRRHSETRSRSASHRYRKRRLQPSRVGSPTGERRAVPRF
jgi:hypothetical protein